MKDMVRFLAVVLAVILFIVFARILLPPPGRIKKPHIFYQGQIYCQEGPVKEYDLDELCGDLTKDGRIHTLLESTQLCDSDYQTNSGLFMDAAIYKQNNGDLDTIYLQLSEVEDTVRLFYQSPPM